MYKTIAVFVGGAFVGIAALLALFLVVAYHVPGGINIYSFLALQATVGVAVGLFVGIVQNNNAGVLAAFCLLPFLLWSLVRPQSPLWLGGRVPMVLVGEALSFLVAFIVANHLSKARRGAQIGVPGVPPAQTLR
jgi:hypothetical protein